MLERMKERWPLVRPLLIPLAVYLILLPGVALFLEAHPWSLWRYLVVLAPMIPGAFIAVGLVRVIRQLDELSRKIIYESLAITFAVTLFLLLALGLLEMAGLPQVSSLYLTAFMIVVLIVAKVMISRRYE
jgi:hypothetical protein